MFYSQFILAKKGPLGTIWIAAHLERKLRKNQVADTDIGVSVDSILFPEVPIALRLSSHLLLGVVRIYSRKVNYLFHDCSEALLKIKQAFRSTAVDLPPEEATAPYHSITLPETFDLDDFELPDSAFFQGNVDHHVSTREQITLQDTMEGVVYSTSQFGLDERFGDGDASQIGLDLDEDLFLDKVAVSGHAVGFLASEEDVDSQACGQPMTPFTNMDVDEDHNNEEILEAMLGDGSGEQIDSSSQDPRIADEFNTLHGDRVPTPDPNEEGFLCKQIESPSLNPSTDLVECVQDSSTHDLVEEAILTNVEEVPMKITSLSCNQYLESEDHNSRILAAKGKPGEPSNKLDLHNQVTNNLVDCSLLNEKSSGADIIHMPNGENESLPSGLQIMEVKQQGNSPSSAESMDPMASDIGRLVFSPISVLAEQPKPISPVSEDSDRIIAALDGQEGAETFQNRVISNQAPIFDQTNEEGVASLRTPLDTRASSSACSHEASILEEPCGRPHCDIASVTKESNITRDSQPESDGEWCHLIVEANQIVEPHQYEEIQAHVSKSNEHLDNVISEDTRLDILSCLANSELPAPETLLSAPARVSDMENELSAESTPDKEALAEHEGSGDGLKILSGKKRRSMESTPNLQSENSAELSGMPRSKRTADSIPDDNDLLSSILVGRKTSTLKMRPTPPPPEVVSSKRTRVAPGMSVHKRKMLVDDTMVLHGDTIRQQLTSTEDIRRIRRKAPCTRPEIWMIQKQLLEDEIFSEPIFIGMSMELTGLYNHPYDLTEVKFSQIDANYMPLEVLKDMGHSVRTDFTSETSLEGCTEATKVRNDGEALNAGTPLEDQHSKELFSIKGCTEAMVIRNDGEAQPNETFLPNENQQSKEHVIDSHSHRCYSQEQTEGLTVIATLDSSNGGHLVETAMEIDKGDNNGIADVVGHSAFPVTELPLPTTSSTSLYRDNCTISAGSVIHAPIDKGNVPGSILQTNDSYFTPNQKLDVQSVEKDAFMSDRTDGNEVEAIHVAGVNGESLIPSEGVPIARDGFTLGETEVGGVPADSSIPFETVNPPFPGASLKESGQQTGSVVETFDQVPEGIRNSVVDGNEVVAEKLKGEEGMVPFVGGENLGCEEGNPKSTMDAEVATLDNAAVRDCGDLESTIDRNDTEFLNVDDDEVAEEEDIDMPSAEEPQFLENSGWSSRTRAVARYLQTLFNNEAGLGRKVIIDNFLAGKTRKEASRMFFETLVLKTKDYIHVEQENSFDGINIQPRVKLMKSEF